MIPQLDKPNFPLCRIAGVWSGAVIIMSILFGCSSPGPPQPSGFLDNYGDLEADPDDPSLLWWEQPGFDWRDYTMLQIDPVYIRLVQANEAVSEEELQTLADEFTSVVASVLGEDYPIVTAPGPQVLRVRCAITDVVAVSPSLNLTTSLLALVPAEVGGSSIEMEFLDSQSGTRLAAGIDRKVGSRLDALSSFSRLGYARAAFRDWAEELRDALETNP